MTLTRAWTAGGFALLLAWAWQEPPRSSATLELTTVGRAPARVYLFRSGQPFRLFPVQAMLPVRSDLFYRDRLWLDGGDPSVLEVAANDEHHYFLLKGAATFHLPPGQYRVEAYRGFFHTPAVREFELTAGGVAKVELDLAPWANSEEWISADDHIHLTRTRREDPVFLAWMEAENLNVGNFLQLQRKADAAPQYAFGREGEYRRRGYAIRSGQETRNQSFGHILFLGGGELVRPLSTGAELANTPEDDPFHTPLFDRARAAGALTGYAHFRERPRHSTLYMDLALGKLHFLELFQFGELATAPWYELLNAGFRPTGIAGSDFPVYLARLKPYPRWLPLLGPERAMVKAAHGGDPFAAWAKGVRENRVMVSNGPLVELTRTGDRLEASASFWRPIVRLEVVRNGLPVAVAEGAGRTRVSLTVETRPGENAWYAARVVAEKREGEPEIQAHTSPLFFGDVKDAGARRLIADAWAAEIERYRAAKLVFSTPERRREFLGMMEKAATILRQ